MAPIDKAISQITATIDTLGRARATISSISAHFTVSDFDELMTGTKAIKLALGNVNAILSRSRDRRSGDVSAAELQRASDAVVTQCALENMRRDFEEAIAVVYKKHQFKDPSPDLD